MALPALALVVGSVHHAVTLGTVDVGAGEGQVPAFGTNQLMLVDVTVFDEQLRRDPRFADQLYVTAVSQSTTLSAVALDAVEFNLDAEGLPIQLRLRLDIVADSDLYLRLEFHHSAGR